MLTNSTDVICTRLKKISYNLVNWNRVRIVRVPTNYTRSKKYYIIRLANSINTIGVEFHLTISGSDISVLVNVEFLFLLINE